jgi:hypothetical protein
MTYGDYYTSGNQNKEIYDTSDTNGRLAILKKYTLRAVLRDPLLFFKKGRLKSAVFAKMKDAGVFIPLKFKKHFHHESGLVQEMKTERIWNEKEFYCKSTHGWTVEYINKYANRYKIYAIIIICFLLFFLFRKNNKTQKNLKR